MVAFKLNKAPNTPKQIQITATTKASNLAIETLVMFKCEVCNFETRDQETFKNHQYEAHGCVCETCKELLKNQSDLEKHIKDHHTRPCITCDLDFRMVSDLREHMKISHGPQCNLCSNSFDTNEELVKRTA